MKIDWIKLKNFRNYQSFDEHFSPSLNIFIGDNAQGKSNLIESIYIIGTTKSFRKVESDNFIRIDEKGALLNARIKRNNLDKDVTFKFIESKRKEIIVNNKKIIKSSDYIGNINVTLFSPDDLQIIKGDASNRRRFMDTLLCQTDPVYLNNLINYQRVLKQRNSILKLIKNNESTVKELEPWNEQLVNYGAPIIKARYSLCITINQLAKRVQHIIKANEDLSLNYKDSLFNGEQNFGDSNDIKEKMRYLTEQRQAEEKARGTTVVGPHRDDIQLCINHLDTRYFASQGQQRSSAISLRMAEVEYIYQILNEYPILLLDDIFSELDDNRKQFLFEYLKQDIQIFLTGTRTLDFKPIINQARMFTIKEGRVDGVTQQ